MLDRTDTKQFHYYQPGIGSYIPGQMSNTSKGSLYTQFKDSIIEHWDEAFGVSFVDHVVAGYKFLMRFHKPGDNIYIFGFSRGAYTARYLTEMIFHIGLLSEGNEEMIRFAWDTFSDFQTALVKKAGEKDPQAFLSSFKDSFCREKVRVHFLGLFDCVNSVTQFQNPFARASTPCLLKSPADHIRHAVSIHERRVSFKPALFLLENPSTSKADIKEVYFAGNHGDVGGGWNYEKDLKVKDTSATDNVTSKEGLPILLSHIPLQWMMREVRDLDNQAKDGNVLKWQSDKVESIDNDVKILNEVLVDKVVLVKQDALRKLFHDPLKIGRGCSTVNTWFWWILETLPVVPYYDLDKDDKWVARLLKPNLGKMRKIPRYVAAGKVAATKSGKSVTYFHKSVQMLKDSGAILENEMSKPGHASTTWSSFGWFQWNNGSIKVAHD
ncbi:hypothetical protein EG329_002227 [Mollisiaceae sp. DMI_Dod_QoI]|nr:hypothetical protein EG329_002227 [Helotiales sp. DMI_Dod_QoI]